MIDQVVACILKDEAICAHWQEQQIEVQVSVSFVGPRSIRKLNREYRDIDKTTDVLSFPMLEMHEGNLIKPLTPADFDYTDKNKRILFLGDIIINIGQAFKQAEEYEHSREREVAFLITHSFLHLLGYDHLEYKQEKIMKARQKEIMNKLELSR